MPVSLLLASLLGTADAAPTRLDDPVEPLALDIQLTVDPSEDTFTGTVRIPIAVDERIDRFRLHGDELTLGQATLTRGRRTLQAEVTPLEHGRIEVVSPRRLKPGTWTLTLDYTGPIHDQPYGLYAFETDGETYLVTQLEADDARTVWPCFDEPGFKVPHTLTVTAPTGLTVVSNAPVADQRAVEGLTVHRFEATPPIPTYAAALAVGPYERVPMEDLPVPGAVYVPKGHAGLAGGVVSATPAVTEALQDWFGTPYPFAKLDVIAATECAFGAMENPGAIVIAERFLYGPDEATPEREGLLTEIMAHEVGHMWFGNLVTMGWWDDFWLNESFAEWIAGRTTHQVLPHLRRDLDEVRQTARMIRADGAATARPLRTEVDPAAVFETANFAVYPKGEAVLSMAEQWIGSEAFQQGLRLYLDVHARGNAEARDLFEALTETGQRQVGPYLVHFLDRPGAPSLDLTLQEGTLTVTQDRYRRLGVTEEQAPARPWRIPLVVDVQPEEGPRRRLAVPLLDPVTEVPDVGPVRWVLPVPDGVGYFAWSLPTPMMEALLADLPSLTPAEQVAVLGNLRTAVEGGDRGLGEVLGLVAALPTPEDPEVLLELAGLLGPIRVAEDRDDPDLLAAARGFVRDLAGGWLATVGAEATEGEPAAVSEVRRRLRTSLAWAHDPDTLALADRIAAEVLDGTATVDPDTADWAVDTWLERAPADVAPALRDLAEAATSPRQAQRWWARLGALRDAEARAGAQDLVLSDGLPPRAALAVLGGLRTAYEDDEAGYADWAMAHHDALSALLPPQFRMYLAGAGLRCDAERLEEVRAFYGDPVRVVPGTERILAEVSERVRTCQARREAHGASLAALLRPGD